MTQLNQIVAIEKGVKSSANKDFTTAYRLFETKTAQLNGIARNYQPIADDGEQFPAESTKVQVKVGSIIGEVRNALTRLFDVTLTKDVANSAARADIIVDGSVLVPQVPVTYLLFLEKQLIDIHTFVSKLPILDQGEDWEYDRKADAWSTPAVKTVKTKKIPRNHVLYEATPEHPAQVQMFTEDVVVGYWTTVKYSGALPRQRVNELTTRVTCLIEAVKKAREAANTTPITDQSIGSTIFDYLLA